MVIKRTLRLSCPGCKSSAIETNPAKGNEELAPEQVAQLDKFRCRDCKVTFNKCEERWQH